MGYYKWSSAWVYSGEMVLLDGTTVSACVKTPKVTMADNAIGETASEAATALIKTVLESKGRLQGVNDDTERMLDASDRLEFIPRFGYLLCNGDVVSVTTKNGEDVNAIVAFRCQSARGQMKPFYCFESGNGSVYTGKIGNFKVSFTTSDSLNDKVAMHFEMVAYK